MMTECLILTLPIITIILSVRLIRDNLLTIATLCGAIAGVALGLSLKSMGDGIYTSRQSR